mgnify:CR=1 FL=1
MEYSFLKNVSFNSYLYGCRISRQDFAVNRNMSTYSCFIDFIYLYAYTENSKTSMNGINFYIKE